MYIFCCLALRCTVFFFLNYMERTELSQSKLFLNHRFAHVVVSELGYIYSCMAIYKKIYILYQVLLKTAPCFSSFQFPVSFIHTSFSAKAPEKQGQRRAHRLWTSSCLWHLAVSQMVVHEVKEVRFSTLLMMKWEQWNTNVPAWHGACVLLHINLVTAGYLQPISQPRAVCMHCMCVSCSFPVFLGYLMREVSMCVCVGCARGIIITSLLIAVITAKCWRDWEGCCVRGEKRDEKVRMYLQDAYRRAR